MNIDFPNLDYKKPKMNILFVTSVSKDIGDKEMDFILLTCKRFLQVQNDYTIFLGKTNDIVHPEIMSNLFGTSNVSYFLYDKGELQDPVGFKKFCNYLNKSIDIDEIYIIRITNDLDENVIIECCNEILTDNKWFNICDLNKDEKWKIYSKESKETKQ